MTPYRFPSGTATLAGQLSRPVGRRGAGPGIVLCHGFPSGSGGAATSARTYPELADRISRDVGWSALAFTFRGAGESTGSFSLGGWLDDVRTAVDHMLALSGVTGVWVAGFGTGGALAICAAADDPRIRGVAALAAPADFDDWARAPRRLLQHARDIGLIRDPDFPPNPEAWARELRAIRPVASVSRVRPRPLLIVHGTEDESVPELDARVIGDAHGEAELRFVTGAGHRLRHDPRALAVLLGWLDRQRHQRPPPGP